MIDISQDSINFQDAVRIDTMLFGELIIPIKSGITECYTATLNGKKTTFMLDIWGECIKKETLSALKKLLDNIPIMCQKGKLEITNLKDTNGIIKNFIEFHLKELDDEQMTEYFNVLDIYDVSEEMFLEKVDVCSIWFSCVPSKNEIICNIDFAIDDELSDEVLVVRFDEDRTIIDISHES